MYISNVFVTALAATSTAQAFNVQEEAHAVVTNSKRALGNLLGMFGGMIGMNRQQDSACPAVWSEISAQLSEQFLVDGQCTDAARAAIRSSFHDCFNGACDGSLLLSDECSRPGNRGLERLCGNLNNVRENTGVGAADLIQFAAAHAIKTCPGGPTVPVFVGREDSEEPNPDGILPTGHAKSGDLIKLFGSRGFSPVDLAALLGAHTVAKQRTTNPNAPPELDSTVGTWDNKYYSETKRGQAPFSLPSDQDIAKNPITAGPFAAFGFNKAAWDVAFVNAMKKMSMIGVNQEGLIDCTSALPGGSRKRDVRNSNLFDRFKF